MDALHHLLRSLSMSEKRYFRLFARRHSLGEGNHYVALYEAMQTVADYEESAFREQFAGAPFLRDLNSERHYLRQSLFRAMRQFYAGRRVLHQIEDLIRDADFLEQKGMYKECGKMLRKAKRRARKYEQFGVWLEVLRGERRLLKQLAQAEQWEQLDALLLERDGVMADLRNREAIQDVHDRLLLLVRQRTRISAEVQETRLAPLIVQLDALTARSVYAGILLDYSHWLRWHLLRDYAAAWSALDRARATWEAHPHFIRAWPAGYKLCLSNLLAACHFTDRYAEMPALLERLRALPGRGFNAAAESFQNLVFYGLLYALNTGDFAAGLALEAELSAGLERYREKLARARQLSIYLNMALLHWVSGQPQQGLRWLRRILHSGHSEHRRDIQAFARVLHLVLHWERGNLDVIEVQLRNYAEQLRRLQEQTWFEQVVLRGFRAALAVAGTPDAAQPWQALLTALDAAPAPRIGYEELKLWLRAQLTGSDFGQLWRAYLHAQS